MLAEKLRKVRIEVVIAGEEPVVYELNAAHVKFNKASIVTGHEDPLGEERVAGRHTLTLALDWNGGNGRGGG